MRHTSTETSQRYTDCLALFIKYRGKNISRIEREMQRLGHRGFTRRILYNRSERGTHRPGWIERYGWKEMPNAECGTRNAKSKPHGPVKTPLLDRRGGGVFADGVVDPTRSEGRAESRSGDADHPRCSTTPPFGHPSYPGGEFDRRPRTVEVASSAEQATVRIGDTDISYKRRPVRASERARFKSWLKLVSPSMTWDWAHQEYLYTYLNKVSDGTCKRLMIFMPPRHGKSETVTVRYTAWRMAHDPSMNVILGSYNQRLANRFSRKIRRVLTDDAALSEEAQSAGQNAQSAGFSPSAGEATDAAPGSEPHNLPKDTARRRDLANGIVCPTQQRSEARTLNTFAHRPANSEAEWETGQGGGLRAVGVGSGVTGFGASLIVVDDPVKSRAEAESETYRDKVWDWFNDDLYTRLEPNGAIILIQTRWHEDDLAGRLIKEMHDGGEHWEIVDLPALCEESETAAGGIRERGTAQSSPPYEGGVAASSPTGWFSPSQSEGRLKAGLKTLEPGLSPISSPPRPGVSAVQPTPPKYDPIGRLPGDALCPQRYDEAALEKLRRKLGSYSFSALYQQRPVPAEGGLFKIGWFKNIIAAPPAGLKWNRGYDLAVSTKTTACYTASARCAFDREGNLYISDVFRKRLEFPDQRKYIVERIALERDTEHGVELALHGHAIIQDLRRIAQLRGRPFRGVKVDADKITRALGWANLAEEGKVILVRGPWIQEFLTEVREFPNAKFDDQIDAVSLAVNMCKRRASSFHSF